MTKIKKGLLVLLILLTTSVIYAAETDNKLPQSDTIDITWDLTEDGYAGHYSLKFTKDGSGTKTESITLTTDTSNGSLKGTGTCYLEWKFFATTPVEVSVYSSSMKGKVVADSTADPATTQSLDWYADITDDSGESSNAVFESSPVIGSKEQNTNYGTEENPVKVFSYDPSTNGLQDSGKAKFAIETEDASSLKPDSFTTTLTAVVKAKDSGTPIE